MPFLPAVPVPLLGGDEACTTGLLAQNRGARGPSPGCSGAAEGYLSSAAVSCVGAGLPGAPASPSPKSGPETQRDLGVVSPAGPEAQINGLHCEVSAAGERLLGFPDVLGLSEMLNKNYRRPFLGPSSCTRPRLTGRKNQNGVTCTKVVVTELERS